MRIVRTVNGDIAPADLGVTQTHEHLRCDQRLCRSANGFPSDTTLMVLTDTDLVVEALADFRASGGRAIAEMTVMGWGRDVAVLAEISARAGIHVIATSGFYVEDCLPDFARTAGVEELTEFLVREITEGADGTGIRTGILKSGVGRPVIEGVELRCAQAVARAQRITGVAITTHTSGSSRFEIRGGNLGLLHLDVFESEGVDPSRVIIGHTDENADIRQLLAPGEARRHRAVRRDRQDALVARRNPRRAAREAGGCRLRRPAAPFHRPLPRDRAEGEGRPGLRPPPAEFCSQAAASRI